jgi:hypothetical protein
MLGVGVLLCISEIKPGVQCTHSVEGDMLGVGVLLCISDIGPDVQCTYSIYSVQGPGVCMGLEF